MKVTVLKSFRDKLHPSKFIMAGETLDWDDERANAAIRKGLVKKVVEKAKTEKKDK